MRLSERARQLVRRCDELSAFADADGVVPVVPINQEPPADQRLRTLLEASYSPPSQGGVGGGLGAREEGTHNQAADATLPSDSPP